jgi:hypothetical protein
MKPTRKAVATAACLALVLAGVSGGLAEAAGEQRRSLEVTSLELQNLIGEVSITGHEGPGFEILVKPGGKDADDDAPKLEVSQDGERAEVTIRFPTSQRFVYPALGKGSTTRFDPEKNKEHGWFFGLVHGLFGKEITVSGSGSGLEVWADVEIRVPRDGSLTVRHGAGHVLAASVTAELDIEIRSGGIEAQDVDGALRAQAGSGAVDVARVVGALTVASGSGSVVVRDARGPSARIASGSGRVKLERVDSDSLNVATGSGGIEAREIGAGEASVASGSGGVTLELARMGDGPFRLATGSGRVVLGVPPGASMDVHAETGSGSIDLDLDTEMSMTRKERDEVAFTTGGGDTRVRIGTGSGGIRIASGG